MPVGPLAALPPQGPPAAPASAGASFGAALRAAGASLPAPAAPARAPGPAAGVPGSAGSAAREALASIERAQRRLDAVLEAARRGRTFTAQELLVLQAQAYRCAQTLDVASKAVEHAAQSVKQAASTQV